jgi:hypothetical protein
MTQHNTVLLPLETWAYSSPELAMKGQSIDIGLFAEALLYYDCVIVNPQNQNHFADFIRWFLKQNKLDTFYSLLKEGVLKIYDYSFITTAIQKDGSYSIWNIQDPIQKEENTFEQRFLYHKSIENLFPKARKRIRLYDALRDNVIEAKADDFGNSVKNAKKDYHNHHRNALVIQAFVDELYSIKKLGKPPEIEATVIQTPGGSKTNITWNISFDELTKLSGDNIKFHNGIPLTASAVSNRFIWSAASLNCDLFLPKPMSILVGDKLYESVEKIAKCGEVIEDLKAKVEFPNIRKLVNDGKLDIDEILKIRKKSKIFRSWLQQESERDRDAIIAYHNEISNESGFLKGARKALNLFGLIGGGAIGGAIGASMIGPVGGAVGGGIGGVAGYLAELTSKIGADWKPVIFGEWVKNRIEHIVKDKA